MKKIKHLISFLLASAMLFLLCACGQSVVPSGTSELAKPDATSSSAVAGNEPSTPPRHDLMSGVEPDAVSPSPLSEADISALAKTYMKLFKATLAEDKTSSLISPLSIITALGMTADGAVGETLSEFEAFFGLDTARLDRVMNYYYGLITSEREGAKFGCANSLWFANKPYLNVKEAYLARVLGAYAPQMYTVDFSDKKTVDEINGWVNLHTDGMIKKIVERLSPNTVAALINAIVFDARWSREYDDFQVSDGKFTAYSGDVQDARMMSSTEGGYIKLSNGQGFTKYYKGGGFKFVALLPDEGVDVFDFINSLDAEELTEKLGAFSRVEVHAKIPKFSYDYDINLEDILPELGLKKAFEPYGADFSDMATLSNGENIYISEVIHKTHIELTESGTKAAAVTAVIMVETTSFPMERERVDITLDRPFVYMIVDTETNLPVFMGTLTEVG